MPIQWRAIYSDGEILPQYNEDGSENKYADIDRTRLSSFELSLEGRVLFCLHLDPGQHLIYRRRVELPVGGSPLVVYLVGWQMTVNGQNVQSIAYVSQDGEVHLAGAWRNDHPWFYQIQPVPEEQDANRLPE